MRSWHLAFVLVAVCLGLVGCAKKRKRTEPPGPVIRKTELAGVERFKDKEFYEYINLRPTRPFAIRNKSFYTPGLETIDKRRIVQVYEAHGYYDATVDSIEVDVRKEDKPVRKQRAKVHIAVTEGAPTKVRRVVFEWTLETGEAPERAEIEAKSSLQPDSQFDLAALSDSAEAMVTELHNRGYPEAAVIDQAQVDKERRIADVRYQVTPGRRATIGEIEVTGLDQIPLYLVQRELKSFPGKQYSPSRLSQIESAVYGLDVFATVSISLDPVQADGTVDLEVAVTETKLQRFRVGLGIGIDPARWEQRASVKYSHQSLFGHLTRLEVVTRVGYAELPAIYQPDEHGPITEVSVEMRKKGFLEDKLVWTAKPAFELGIWEGYQYYTVTHRLAVSRFFTRYVELGLSYNNRFTDFFNISPTLDANRTFLGLDFRDPYILAYAGIDATLHLTDDLTAPDNGVKLVVNYDLASTYLGGQFDFHKFEPDLRLYYRPHDRIKLAARFRIGLIVPYGRNPGAPIDLQWYLGGANDVRGWPLRRLSPRVVYCGDDGECDSTAVGGMSMVNGTAEFRVRAVSDLWIASFLDMGDVRSETFAFDTNGWMYSVGGGLRYDSSIGLFRLDAGFRLNNDSRFSESRFWAIHFGLGEAF